MEGLHFCKKKSSPCSPTRFLPQNKFPQKSEAATKRFQKKNDPINRWSAAVKKARQQLGIKGFKAIKKGSVGSSTRKRSRRAVLHC